MNKAYKHKVVISVTFVTSRTVTSDSQALMRAYDIIRTNGSSYPDVIEFDHSRKWVPEINEEVIE